MFILCKLVPEPIDYECWCDDICHATQKEKDEHDKEEEKKRLLEAWGAHYYVRATAYVVVLVTGLLGKKIRKLNTFFFKRPVIVS